jgi:hypothetical protein
MVRYIFFDELSAAPPEKTGWSTTPSSSRISGPPKKFFFPAKNVLQKVFFKCRHFAFVSVLHISYNLKIYLKNTLGKLDHLRTMGETYHFNKMGLFAKDQNKIILNQQVNRRCHFRT